MACYLKALCIPQKTDETAPPLFFQTMSTRTQRLLRNYVFAAWYMSTRLYFTSLTASTSTLKRYAMRQRRPPSLKTFVLLLLMQCGVEEGVHFLCRVLGEVKSELLGMPLLGSGAVCCICQDETRGRSLFNFCAGCTQHLAHWECMAQWYTSSAQLANCCPLCREPLRLSPAPLSDRLFVQLASKDFWKGVLARCLLHACCFTGSVLLTRIAHIMASLRRSLRPGGRFSDISSIQRL